MNIENLIKREHLSKIKNYDQFFELRQSLVGLGSARLFDALFSMALQYELDGASSIAAMLLIEFDPKALRQCDQLLLEIANSNWFLSDKFIPFYLLTQFGKWNLISAIDELLSGNSLNHDQRIRIEGIKYWAKMPAVSLSSEFSYFEWQEVIEGKNA